MQQPLFRPEALRRHGERLWGDLILWQPLSWRLLTLALSLLCLGALGFLVSHDYVRKQRVHGLLVPDRGLIEVRSPAAGTLLAVTVAEDSQVQAGSPLFTVQLDPGLGGEAALTEQLLAELAQQATALALRRQQEIRQKDNLREQHALQRAYLEARLHELSILLENETTLLDLHMRAAERAVTLQARGLLAVAESETVQARQLQQQSTLHQLQLQQAQTAAELHQLDSEHNAALLAGERELQRIQSEEGELRKQGLRLGGEQRTAALAPVSGRVSSVLRQTGMSVGSQEQVLSLIPDGSQLQVELLLPSSAIGFVRPGQVVRLRYEAFAYQKFGVQQARITRVPDSALLQPPVNSGAKGGEPVYRVQAELERQHIVAYGRQEPLRAGMLLSADIELESRSLFEWLLEPLFSIRGAARR